MAEPGGAPIIPNRRLIIIVGAVIAVIVVFFIISFRSCIPTREEDRVQVIYSHLDLKDAANVIARLKELKIPYEVRDKGTSIAVPKERADEARLGLAEKNLPRGGLVGWEIFDEARMGATDFDRRIQLIRAISGELSRTIRRINGVEDARVQIVLPETRLFEATVAPVTASVLLRLAPGSKLKTSQVSGIIHLVASSVENLKPENVTVVDEAGNILSALVKEKKVPPTVELPSPPPVEKIKIVEEKKPPVEKEKIPEIKEITFEKYVMAKLKAKEEYEKQLVVKIEDLLAKFYPPKSLTVKLDLDLGDPSKKAKVKTFLKIKVDGDLFSTPIKKINVLILVDNRIELTRGLKKVTFNTVAAAIPYDRARGDRIILQKAPFHYAMPEAEISKEMEKMLPKEKGFFSLTTLLYIAVIGIIIFAIWRIFIRKKPSGLVKEIPEEKMLFEEEEKEVDLNDLKTMAQKQPEKIAALLKSWLTEE